MVQWILRRFPLLFTISIYCRKVLVLRLHQKHHLDDEENHFFVLRGETFARLHDGVRGLCSVPR